MNNLHCRFTRVATKVIFFFSVNMYTLKQYLNHLMYFKIKKNSEKSVIKP